MMKENISGNIEPNARAKRRIQRFKDFDAFYSKSKTIFNSYKEGKREKYFESLYMLYVVPGSRAGATESNIVDVFWGNRPFDKTEELANGQRRIHFKKESGATIFFFEK